MPLHSSFLRPGSKLDSYVLIKKLGSGFSADVWSAQVEAQVPGLDVNVGDKVAIKIYKNTILEYPDHSLRIGREFMVAQRIQHKNLVRIHEYVLSSSRPNHNFMVMELVEGEMLSSYVKKRVKLNYNDAKEIFYQLHSALCELHIENILHRDIKPSNIIVQEDKNGVRAVLLDLGIVLLTNEKNMTIHSAFLGSKRWAPCEQLMGDSLDFRADLYSLASVFYFMVTGREPFEGEGTEAAIAVAMLRDNLKIPLIEGAEDWLIEKLNACLQTDLVKRPEKAEDILRRSSGRDLHWKPSNENDGKAIAKIISLIDKKYSNKDIINSIINYDMPEEYAGKLVDFVRKSLTASLGSAKKRE